MQVLHPWAHAGPRGAQHRPPPGAFELLSYYGPGE